MKSAQQIAGKLAANRLHAALLVVLAIWLVYLPALDNQLTNWDDDKYIKENYLIGDLGIQQLGRMFGPSARVVGNYHPLTVLSFSLNHHLSGTQAWAYIFTNILLHSLVALILLSLLRRLTGDALLALLAVLFFALHPMRVESVAWVSERKDVLYMFFYLLALYTYVEYLEAGRRGHFYAALGLFTLSVLSKGQAVTLPAVLILVDYLRGRCLRKPRPWAEKLPFLIVSGIGAYLAFTSQGSVGYVSSGFPFSFGQQLIFASAGLSMYLLKGIAPFSLSAFYPYPYEAQISKTVPAAYYLFLVPLIIYIIICITVFVRSRKEPKYRLLFFALVLFFVALAPVLQLFPVGIAYMADRYSYLPSVGLSLVLAMLFVHILRKGLLRKWALGGLILVLAYYGSYTAMRCNVWQNSLSLWRDVVSKHDKVATAWNNLGEAQKNIRGDLASALESYNRALELDPSHYRAYSNRGNILAALGRHKEAIRDFSRAIGVNPDEAVLYYNRGLSYAITGQLQAARADYERALRLNPDFISRQHGYAEGLAMLGSSAYDEGNHDKAIRLLGHSLQLKPSNPRTWYNRGVVFDRTGRHRQALKDYSEAIRLDPAYVQAYYNRGRLLLRLGMKEEACYDLQQAARAGYRDAGKLLGNNCY